MKGVTVTAGWILRRQAQGYSLVSAQRDRETALPLPLGVAYRNGDRISVSARGDDIIVRLYRAQQSAILYPPFRRRFRLPRLGLVRVMLVTDRNDRETATALIEKEHYLPAPKAGVFLVARHRAKVIGAAVLGVLNHAVPVGRRRFLRTVGGTSANHAFLWARRFAVRRSYHGCGIGRALAISCTGVARRHLVPRPIAVEVITMKRERFLLDAGYALVCVTPGRRVLREAPGRPVKARNYYYVRSVRSA